MRKMVWTLIVAFVCCGLVAWAQEPLPTSPQEEKPAAAPANPSDINLGRISVPRDFVHAGKEYKAGVYRVVLTLRDNVPFFLFSSPKKELLFEELAAVKPNPKGRPNAKAHRVKQGLMKDKEYFRIVVEKGDRFMIAYLMLKTAS